MSTLRQDDPEIKLRFLSPKGRPVNLVLVTPVDYSRVPAWLDEHLVVYGRRFDWGTTFDARGVLKILRLPVVEDWGLATDANGQALFVSGVLDPEDAMLVRAVAERLTLAWAFAVEREGHRFVLGPKGAWR